MPSSTAESWCDALSRLSYSEGSESSFCRDPLPLFNFELNSLRDVAASDIFAYTVGSFINCLSDPLEVSYSFRLTERDLVASFKLLYRAGSLTNLPMEPSLLSIFSMKVL